MTVKSVKVTDDFGTIVVALGVADYILPVLEDDGGSAAVDLLGGSITTDANMVVTDYGEKYGVLWVPPSTNSNYYCNYY